MEKCPFFYGIYNPVNKSELINMVFNPVNLYIVLFN